MKIDARSHRRIIAIKALVKEFGRRDLTNKDAAKITSLSDHGAGKYLRDLAGMQIIAPGGKADYPVHRSKFIYRLIADPHAVARFIADIEAGIFPKRATYIRPAPPIPAHVPLKPFRDALVAALFGPAPGARA